MSILKKALGEITLVPSLTIVQGEGKPSRFERSDRMAASVGRDFFGLVHRTLNYQGPFAEVRRILREVDLKPEERGLYVPWLNIGSWEAVNQADMRKSVSPKVLDRLEAQDDPFIHVKDCLEQYRMLNLPDIEVDIVLREKTFAVYALIAASLHGCER